MDNTFEIKGDYNNITIEKNGAKYRIEKSPDGDIWFISYNDKDLEINFYSNNIEEWNSYVIFERLIRLILGKYILYENKPFSSLPDDFVDLNNKSILWHSDGNNDNILKIQFKENLITISILRDKKINNRNTNNPIKVRIRTNGSDYGNYYQEFKYFFDELVNFTIQINEMKKQNTSINETQSKKRLTIFNKIK